MRWTPADVGYVLIVLVGMDPAMCIAQVDFLVAAVVCFVLSLACPDPDEQCHIRPR